MAHPVMAVWLSSHMPVGPGLRARVHGRTARFCSRVPEPGARRGIRETMKAALGNSGTVTLIVI